MKLTDTEVLKLKEISWETLQVFFLGMEMSDHMLETIETALYYAAYRGFKDAKDETNNTRKD